MKVIGKSFVVKESGLTISGQSIVVLITNNVSKSHSQLYYKDIFSSLTRAVKAQKAL